MLPRNSKELFIVAKLPNRMTVSVLCAHRIDFKLNAQLIELDLYRFQKFWPFQMWHWQLHSKQPKFFNHRRKWNVDQQMWAVRCCSDCLSNAIDCFGIIWTHSCRQQLLPHRVKHWPPSSCWCSHKWNCKRPVEPSSMPTKWPNKC